MLNLILFRHGKSDWSANYGKDHDRPLASRGVKAAKTMGMVLANAKQLPDLIITSTALRARNTLKLAANEGKWDSKIKTSKELYDTDTATVIKLIRRLPDNPKRLMLVGHESNMAELTAQLTGNLGRIYFPTGAMVSIDFDINRWSKMRAGNGELRWLLPPKLFTEGSFKL